LCTRTKRSRRRVAEGSREKGRGKNKIREGGRKQLSDVRQFTISCNKAESASSAPGRYAEDKK